MAKLVSSRLGLITPAGAPPESVVDSAETLNEGGSHLRRELAAAVPTAVSPHINPLDTQ